MERADDFLLDDNWAGHWYELGIQLGPRTAPDAEERLVAAMRALWSSPLLEGCYPERRQHPSVQVRLRPGELELDPDGRSFLYGWAQLPLGRIVCLSCFVREEGEDGKDWLDLGIPEGALDRLDPRLLVDEYLIDRRGWQEPLDGWFVELARCVARAVEFEWAIIGEDVSGIDGWNVPLGQRRCSVISWESGDVRWHRPDDWDTPTP